MGNTITIPFLLCSRELVLSLFWPAELCGKKNNFVYFNIASFFLTYFPQAIYSPIYKSHKKCIMDINGSYQS